MKKYIMVFLVLALSYLINAEVLVLNDGSIIKCKILNSDSESVTVLTNDVEITLKIEKIMKTYFTDADYENSLVTTNNVQPESMPDNGIDNFFQVLKDFIKPEFSTGLPDKYRLFNLGQSRDEIINIINIKNSRFKIFDLYSIRENNIEFRDGVNKRERLVIYGFDNGVVNDVYVIIPIKKNPNLENSLNLIASELAKETGIEFTKNGMEYFFTGNESNTVCLSGEVIDKRNQIAIYHVYRGDSGKSIDAYKPELVFYPQFFSSGVNEFTIGGVANSMLQYVVLYPFYEYYHDSTYEEKIFDTYGLFNSFFPNPPTIGGGVSIGYNHFIKPDFSTGLVCKILYNLTINISGTSDVFNHNFETQLLSRNKWKVDVMSNKAFIYQIGVDFNVLRAFGYLEIPLFDVYSSDYSGESIFYRAFALGTIQFGLYHSFGIEFRKENKNLSFEVNVFQRVLAGFGYGMPENPAIVPEYKGSNIAVSCVPFGIEIKWDYYKGISKNRLRI